MKKKELKEALKREKYERECLALGIGHDAKYIEKLQADLEALKVEYANACEINAHQAEQIRQSVFGYQWVPVEDGVYPCTRGYGDTLKIWDNGWSVTTQNPDGGPVTVYLGPDLRICRKVDRDELIEREIDGAVARLQAQVDKRVVEGEQAGEDKDARISELESLVRGYELALKTKATFENELMDKLEGKDKALDKIAEHLREAMGF